MGFPTTAVRATLPSLVAELANALPEAQRRLDRDWLENTHEYAAVRRQLSGTQLEALAAGLAPARLVVRDAKVEAALLLSMSRERSAAIEARLVGLGFRRRFGAGQLAECRIECSVRQSPLLR